MITTIATNGNTISIIMIVTIPIIIIIIIINIYWETYSLELMRISRNICNNKQHHTMINYQQTNNVPCSRTSDVGPV